MAGNSGLTVAEQMSPLFTHSRNGGTGPVNQVGMPPPWWSSNLEREGDSQHVSADCVLSAISTGCCCSYCPLTGSLSPLPFPVPPLPLPCPSVCVATGKEEGRHRVSGGLGCVLGRPLLLLPPGQLGLSSQDPSSLQACCLL